MKRSLIALTAAAVLGTAAPAMAETLSIPYHDLNLATAKGQAALDGRIERHELADDAGRRRPGGAGAPPAPGLRWW